MGAGSGIQPPPPKETKGWVPLPTTSGPAGAGTRPPRLRRSGLWSLGGRRRRKSPPACARGGDAGVPQRGVPLHGLPLPLQGSRQGLPHREAPAGQLDAGLEETCPGQPPVPLVRQLVAAELTRNRHRQPACKRRGTQLVVRTGRSRHVPGGTQTLRKEMHACGCAW